MIGKKRRSFQSTHMVGFTGSLNDLKSVLPECKIMDEFESTASTYKGYKPRAALFEKKC